MWWRVPQGGKLWDQTKGEPAKRAFSKLVKSGQARGILAFDGDEAVGWCAYGPRTDFPRTERSRAYVRDSLDGVWSVNCFFVARTHRQQGVATTLLEAATAAAWKGGARIVEGYPYRTLDGKPRPGPFIWRGTMPMFLDQGYKVVKLVTPVSPLVEASRRAQRRA
jgi:GNAT superfamily N-acetyltransferase